MQRPMYEDRPRPRPQKAWLWFVVGGVFILIPGIVVLSYYNLWGILWIASAGPAAFPFLAVMVGLPALLVAMGLLAILFGVRRFRESRS